MAKPAPGEHREEHRGVVEEENLLIAQEVPPWHSEAVPARPRRHQARGRRWWHVGKPPHSPSTRSRRGEGQATRDQARGRHGRDPERRRRQRWERQGGNRQDLSNRQERHREIYQLAPISTANSSGGRRNQAQRRRGDAVARAGERKRTRWARGVRPVGLTEATWSGSTR
jgi:hypothetical protein